MKETPEQLKARKAVQHKRLVNTVFGVIVVLALFLAIEIILICVAAFKK